MRLHFDDLVADFWHITFGDAFGGFFKCHLFRFIGFSFGDNGGLLERSVFLFLFQRSGGFYHIASLNNGSGDLGSQCGWLGIAGSIHKAKWVARNSKSIIRIINIVESLEISRAKHFHNTVRRQFSIARSIDGEFPCLDIASQYIEHHAHFVGVIDNRRARHKYNTHVLCRL